MKVFPTKNYQIELKGTPEKCIALLTLNTLASDSLSTTLTDKEFIGRIQGNHFEIIGSEVGIGAFTVLKGDFSDDTVNIVAEINKPFKVLISIFFVLAIGGFSYNVFRIGFPKGLGMLVPLAMFIGFIRFIFLGLLFRASSNQTFGKLTRLLYVVLL